MMHDILRRTMERAQNVHTPSIVRAASEQQQLLSQAGPSHGRQMATNPAAALTSQRGFDDDEDTASKPESQLESTSSRLGLLQFIQLLRSNGVREDQASDEQAELVFSKHASMGTGGKINFLAVQTAVRAGRENVRMLLESECES